MKANISRLKPKVINYRNYQIFDEQNFLSDIQQKYFECKSIDLNENYENFVQKLLKIVDDHIPLKSKTVRGKNAFFMNIGEKPFMKERVLKTFIIKIDHEKTGTTTENKEIFVHV